MSEIDLRPGQREFVVSTAIPGRNNFERRMGPDVRVNARDAEHAKEVVRRAGHEVNTHFEPREVKKR